MASFQVRRNKNGEITQVEAPNGKPSILFSTINRFVKDKEQALRYWSQAYTPSFKSWFGDWQNNSSTKNVETQSELLTLQSQILNTNGDINYKELKEACDTVINGQAYINILSLGEETGRTKGGRRHVEASLIATANERANYKKQTDVKRTEQEKLLEEYAKETGSWIEAEEFPESEILGEGAEAKLFKSSKQGYVRKVVNYRKFSKTTHEYLTNRVSLHNYLFLILRMSWLDLLQLKILLVKSSLHLS